jgi:hypothetical protein
MGRTCDTHSKPLLLKLIRRDYFKCTDKRIILKLILREINCVDVTYTDLALA